MYKLHYQFSAVYNWKGDVRSGLPLEIGETVQILEENGGKSLIFIVKHLPILFSSYVLICDNKL